MNNPPGLKLEVTAGGGVERRPPAFKA